MSRKKRKASLSPYHEQASALVGALMPDYDPVQKISIISTRSRLAVSPSSNPQWRSVWSQALYSRGLPAEQMAVALAVGFRGELSYGEDEVTRVLQRPSTGGPRGSSDGDPLRQ